MKRASDEVYKVMDEVKEEEEKSNTKSFPTNFIIRYLGNKTAIKSLLALPPPSSLQEDSNFGLLVIGE